MACMPSSCERRKSLTLCVTMKRLPDATAHSSTMSSLGSRRNGRTSGGTDCHHPARRVWAVEQVTTPGPQTNSHALGRAAPLTMKKRATESSETHGKEFECPSCSVVSVSFRGCIFTLTSREPSHHEHHIDHAEDLARVWVARHLLLFAGQVVASSWEWRAHHASLGSCGIQYRE